MVSSEKSTHAFTAQTKQISQRITPQNIGKFKFENFLKRNFEPYVNFVHYWLQAFLILNLNEHYYFFHEVLSMEIDEIHRENTTFSK